MHEWLLIRSQPKISIIYKNKSTVFLHRHLFRKTILICTKLYQYHKSTITEESRSKASGVDNIRLYHWNVHNSTSLNRDPSYSDRITGKNNHHHFAAYPNLWASCSTISSRIRRLQYELRSKLEWASRARENLGDRTLTEVSAPIVDLCWTNLWTLKPLNMKRY